MTNYRRLVSAVIAVAATAMAAVAFPPAAIAATARFDVTCVVGGGETQLRIPTHLEVGDTLQVIYHGCRYVNFRVGGDVLTPTGEGLVPWGPDALELRSPAGVITFTVTRAIPDLTNFLMFLPQTPDVAASDAVYFQQGQTAAPPAAPATPTPVYTATFVRDKNNCDAGVLTFFGLKPSRRSFVIVGWDVKAGSPYSKGFDYSGRGGHGANWRQRLDAKKIAGLTFPRGAFPITVQYEIVTRYIEEMVFIQEIAVPACKRR